MILHNKEVFPKTIYCLTDGIAEEVKRPFFNIQIKLNGCNANCEFCISKTGKKFNEDLFFDKLTEIREKAFIKRLNITGGEPTINFELYNRIVRKLRELLPETFIVLNTNGYNFEKVFESDSHKYLNNIQLSRHHYIDEINNKILGFKSVPRELIKKINEDLEHKFLNLSCNLIKGYIDKDEEVYKYLDDASDLDIRWVGFVSLIPLNDFCKENYIDFESLNLTNKRLILMQSHCLNDTCKCADYLYVPNDLSFPIKVYNKIIKKSNVKHILVFDGENFNVGFDGELLA
jgi:molybdenum cofactor biosynthesis enzyme MoaA